MSCSNVDKVLRLKLLKRIGQSQPGVSVKPKSCGFASQLPRRHSTSVQKVDNAMVLAKACDFGDIQN